LRSPERRSLLLLDPYFLVRPVERQWGRRADATPLVGFCTARLLAPRMYGTYLNARRKFELLLLFFLVLFAASSTLTDAWLMWLVWIMLLLVLIVVDFMFFSEPSDFIFEPDIRNYARRVTAGR
jgi:hypothetical protein